MHVAPILEIEPDLRRTLGWRLSAHARVTARMRGVSTRSVLDVVAQPELTYPHRGRMVMVRGRLAVVTCPREQIVVTVLLRSAARWTDFEARQLLATSSSSTRREYM